MMRLSESIRKNVLAIGVGSIVNRFKIRKRRDTLFFEDLLADYIKMCEDAGYSREMEDIARQWMYCVIKQTMPFALRKVPPVFVMNNVMRKVWVNLGLMKNIVVSRSGDVVEVRTEDETITRIIGKNAFSAGAYKGVLDVLFGSGVKCIRCSKKGGSCTYLFRVEGGAYCCEFKDRGVYAHLNHFPGKGGFSLKRALEMNVLHLGSDNRLYLRGKPIIIGEQTLFHIIGNAGILLSEVPRISYEYFCEIIPGEPDEQEKLMFLKKILQLMGWGEFSFKCEGRGILMEVKNPPYGFQIEKDNWEFLIRTVLGYLWLVDEGFRVKEVRAGYKCLDVSYLR